MTGTLVFDINETVLDLGALDGLFAGAFGNTGARAEWFGQVLQSGLVLTATGQYRDFGTVGAAALEMVAARRGVPFDPSLRARLHDAMLTLPAHSDVRPALERLRGAGFRIAALTNNPLATVESQLANAELRHLFDRMLSVEGVGRLKPAPEVYHYAASELHVSIHMIRLVAAHAWDVTGAIRAGAAGAFVARPGQVLDPLGASPDIVGRDLVEVAELIVSAG